MAGLAGAGHDVRGIDSVATDEPWADRLVVADLATDDAALDEAVAGTDAVVHLAAIAAETDFETALASHVGLTHRVLEAMRRHGVGRIVVRQQQPRRRLHATRADAADRDPPAPRLVLRARQGGRGGAVQPVPRPPRDRRRLPAHRELPRATDHPPAPVDVAVPRRCRPPRRCLPTGAGPRVHGRVRHLGEHAGVVGSRRRPRPSGTAPRTTPRRGPPRSRPSRRRTTTSSTRATSAASSRAEDALP